MKKTLVVLLALMMVFAFATTAMAADEQYVPYNDIADQDVEIQTAIERLTILGALTGYDTEGTKFAPSQLITREEFATIGVRIAGLEDQVALYASMASAFTDVEEGRWSEGYINAANANGIMIGRGNGVFDPKANVTMQEVTTVLLRAVGYDDRLPGAWPSDYNTKAVNIGLTEYVDYIGPKAATRAEVASMANEALDLWMVQYVDDTTGLAPILGDVDKDGYMYITDMTNEFDLEGDRINLLAKTFDAYVIADAIFDDNMTGYSEAYAWGFEDFADWELEAYYGDYTDNNPVTNEFTRSFATLYGISKGQDVTDLGLQVADLTVNADDEIMYVDITSDIVRTADATADQEDDCDGVIFGRGDIVEGDYGEIWYDAAGDAYAAKDYAHFVGAQFGIVDDVDEDGVYFKDVMADLRVDKEDIAIYLVGEGFVGAEDLEEGDVVYATTDIDGADKLAIAYRPVTGSLDDYNDDVIEIDDVEYGVLATSLYSVDNGSTFLTYDWRDVDDYDWGEVAWVEAYAFTNFVYFTDDLAHFDTGLIDSYQFGSTADRLNGGSQATITGVNVILPGDDEATLFPLADEIRKDDAARANLQDEGSLFTFQLNGDGEIVEMTDGHTWNDDCGNECDVEDLDAAVYAEWNSRGDLVIDAAKADIVDNYTFADDAVIYLVETAGYPEVDTGEAPLYAIGSGQSITVAELEDMGAFTASGIHIETTAGDVINTLYLIDATPVGDKVWNIGVFTGEFGTSNILGSDYMVIGGTKVLVDETAFNTIAADPETLDDTTALVAYYTEGGEIVDSSKVYFMASTAEVDTFTAAAADYAAFQDDLGYSLAYGQLTNYEKTSNKQPMVIGGNTYFTTDFVAGYDEVAADAVDLNALRNCDEVGDDYNAKTVIAVVDGDDYLFYLYIIK